MRTAYAGEVERHLATLTSKEVELVTAALEKVTGSTCEAATNQATGAGSRA